LPLPCLLLFTEKESHLGRSSLHASAFLNRLHILIDLHFIQHSFFVFVVSPSKTSFVATLATFDVVTETAVEQGAVRFKQG
jgi:hypothetical protein